jgi:hypothetical protein
LRGKLGWDGKVFLGLIILLIGLGVYYARSPSAAAVLGDGRPWYGNWSAVAFSVLIFSAFVVGLLHPFKRRDWRGLGITEAYLVALFTEMFGVPLTIYLLGSVFGFKIGFSGLEGPVEPSKSVTQVRIIAPSEMLPEHSGDQLC